jgi:hypothetical protein
MEAQNLENIPKIFDKKAYKLKDNLKLSGNLNFSTMNYQSWDIESRNQPFNYFINGGINLKISSFTLPFTFNLTNRELTYTKPTIPINIVNIAPTYKWAKAYIGVVNMNFSQYSLSGHTFTGIGLELKPKKFRMSMMGGELVKKTSRDTSFAQSKSSYSRFGGGLKIGMDHTFISGDVILFKASDIYDSSIQKLSPTLTPEENFTAEIILTKKIGSNLVVNIDYARSILTRNTQASSSEGFSLIDQNKSTQNFSALVTGIQYNLKSIGLGLKYERVDPDYKTLGGYYFNNDIENITIQPSFKTKNGKLNINSNFGLQSDNLNNQKLKTSIRRIGSCQIVYSQSDRIMTSLQYSNFTSYTNQRTQLDPFYYNVADTLNFHQVNQNLNISNSLTLGKDKNNTINSAFGYQKSSDAANADNESNVLTFNTSFSSKHLRSNLTYNLGVNFYNIYSQNFSSTLYGPMANLSKSFFKNLLKTNASLAYNVNSNSNSSGSIMNCKLGVNYSPKIEIKNKKNQHIKLGNQTISANIIYLKNFNEIVQTQNFSELTINLAYNIGF